MTNSNINEILIRRSLSFDPGVLDMNPDVGTPQYVATFNRNLSSLGFTLGSNALTTLLNTGVNHVIRVEAELIPLLRKSLGAHVGYIPMYPNFPQQVVDASDAELYLNAIMHYFGDAVGARILPVYEKKSRGVLNHTKPLKVIEFADVTDYVTLMQSVISSKVSFSETDREDVKTFVSWNYFESSYVETVPNKENLATVAKYLAETMHFTEEIADQFKTATDVLRFAAALSDGDVSLAAPTRFRKFKKFERRNLLELLNQAGNLEEDMLRYASQWKRLGEILHPGDYAARFPNAAKAFTAIRNNEKIATFNSEVEKAISEKNIKQAVRLLSSRPGEFARRLDQLVTLADGNVSKNAAISLEFRGVASKVSPSVLVQLNSHFESRVDSAKYRSFFPKGQLSKIQVIEETRPALSTDIVSNIKYSSIMGLMEQFESREALGKVFVDESLKGYTIPFGVRSASKSTQTLGRGTRMALPESDTVRLFTWWKDVEGGAAGGYFNRVDIDLSLGLLNENFEDSGTVSYYNMREVGGYHSGDITSAPNGASEFIDIDINKAISAGHRYAYVTLHSYTGQKYSDIPELFAGFMARNGANSGEIYEPKTVENKVDITTESTQAIPYIVDLVNREVIWVDMNIPSNVRGANNVASNRSNLSLVSEAMVTRKAPNLYDLFTIHAHARGSLVTDREDADLVFALDGDVTPFETEKILSEYL